MTESMAKLFLNLMIFIPLLGIPIILLLKKETAKYVALAVSLIPLVLSVFMFLQYRMDTLNTEQGTMVFLQTFKWIEQYNIFYQIGIDGISILLVLLNHLPIPDYDLVLMGLS